MIFFKPLEKLNYSALLLIEAFAHEDLHIRIPLVASAMEKMVGIQQGEPISLKLRESLVQWLPVPERQDVKEKIKAFYDLRSNLVHARDTQKGDDNKNRLLTDAVVSKMAHCLVEMVQWTLDNLDKNSSLDDETEKRRLGIVTPTYSFHFRQTARKRGSD
jgi:hypothetical protein